MGELPKTSKRVTRQSAQASNGSSGRPEVSSFALTESFQKTLSDLYEKVSREFQSAQSQRNEQDRMLGDAPQVVQELLDRAKSYYGKKEYTRAFTAWENVCSYLPEGDAFRRTVVSLRDSHSNLERAQRELNAVREDIQSRFSVPTADRKFIDNAQEGINGDIKKAYAHINREIRSDRTPQTFSFWWPVFMSFAILAGGGLILWGYHTNRMTQAPAVSSAPAVNEASEAELLLLKTSMDSVTAQRDQLRAQLDQIDQDTDAKIAEAKRQAAGSAKNEREKIIQLETRLREKEEEARQLQYQVDGLMQDNIAKDKVIESLN